jgi:peptidoglycan/LPS O-acetylase OafA/YrhL
VLTVIAAYADSRGAHALAFDALLGAIPFAAASALIGFGAYLEDRVDPVKGLQALLWTFALALLVLSCAARSPEAQTQALPALGRSALVGCIAVLVLKGGVALVPLVRRAAFVRPAKP